MDFAYTDEDEAFRTELVDWLDENLPKFLAEWSADDESERRRTAGRGAGGSDLRRWSGAGPGSASSTRAGGPPSRWPEEWGGREATVTQNVIYSETMARYRTPGHLQRQRPVADRPDDHPLGHRRAEGPLDPEHPQRRGPLVPGLHRARGRQRPGQPAHHRRRSTATTTCSTARRSGSRSAHIAKWGLFLVRTDPDAIAEGRKHEGITALDHRPRSPRHRHPAHPRHRRRGDVLRDLLRRRPRARRRTAWAARARAGWWPWARSAPSASARPGWPSACGPTSTRWSTWPAR